MQITEDIVAHHRSVRTHRYCRFERKCDPAVVSSARLCTYSVNRYYHPATGQFLTVDPLVNETGQAYSYGGDDPVNGSDPSGLCVKVLFACLGVGPETSSLSFRFDPGAGANAIVNIGRGASFGLSDTIANWISPGASCTVAQSGIDEDIGSAATIVASLGAGASMDQDWEQAANALADQIGQELSTEVTRSRLSGKLLELKLNPDSDGAPQMNITMSPSEVIFTAGRRTRFELDPLPGSEAEILQLVRWVSSGHLSEQVCRGVVTFKLRLDEHTVLTGSSSSGLIARTEKPQTIEYLPYGNSL